MSQTPVLIAGAGPTGLVLALGLARRGVPLRIIDSASGPGEHSRAVVVHARTLEFYRQFGFADDVIGSGVKMDRMHLREGGVDGKELVSASLGDFGAGLSPYAFALAYPQDDHERFLLAQLRAAGVDVEWRSQLSGFTQDDERVTARVLRDSGGSEEIDAAYLCGCDGAHSTVRKTLGITFGGGDYPHEYFVTDVAIAEGFRRDLFIHMGKDSFVLLFPVRSTGMQRLIGLVPSQFSRPEALGFDDIRDHVEPLVDAHVTTVNWFATYRSHFRVAERFSAGRAFLLGDAGHIHSPVGGQGMNTGIGDAVNLAWKLAMVVKESANPSLLATYEEERIPFARRLVATTDRAFTAIIAGGVAGGTVRRVLIPLLFLVGTRFEMGRHAFFRLISQRQIQYEKGTLSEGKAGHVAGGDRLPWIETADNFAPLSSLDWQVHVYGEVSDELHAACERGEVALPVYRFPWSQQAQRAGFERNALYLVRPDGYVALAHRTQHVQAVTEYARAHGLSFDCHGAGASLPVKGFRATPR